MRTMILVIIRRSRFTKMLGEASFMIVLEGWTNISRVSVHNTYNNRVRVENMRVTGWDAQVDNNRNKGLLSNRMRLMHEGL